MPIGALSGYHLGMASQQRKNQPRVERAIPQRYTEIETKLEIAHGTALPRMTGQKSLAAVGLVGAAPAVVHHLDAVYYDTEHLDLLRSKLTLRRRTGGDDAGWHLKLPGSGRGRTEVRLPLAASAEAVPVELADLVRGAARGRPLVPVARLENHRTVRTLLDRDDQPLIEVADDAVTATPLPPAGGDRQQWRELEVEIVGGTAEQLAATVALLRSAGAEPASTDSKVGRALPLPAPTGPALGRKSAGAAVLGSLTRQRDTLLTADRALRDRQDHALRALRRSARRIGAVLSVFGSLFPEQPVAAVRNGLQDFGSDLDRARDLESLRRRLHAQLADEPEEYARHAQRRLDGELTTRAAVASAAVLDAIDAQPYLQLLRDLDELLDTASPARRASRAASTELPDLIDKSWRRLRDLADASLGDPENAAAAAEVRGAAIRLRYATEATVSALGDNAVMFAAALEEIQEVLGEHGDAVLAQALLVEIAGDDGTDGSAGFIFGRLHAVEQAIALGALDDFADAWDRVEDGDLVAALGR